MGNWQSEKKACCVENKACGVDLKVINELDYEVFVQVKGVEWRALGRRFPNRIPSKWEGTVQVPRLPALLKVERINEEGQLEAVIPEREFRGSIYVDLTPSKVQYYNLLRGKPEVQRLREELAEAKEEIQKLKGQMPAAQVPVAVEVVDQT